jgi:hypothetical protein
VREFVGSSATQRRLFEDSGLALIKSSEGIKRKLDTVAKAVQGLERVAEGQGSKQLRAHYAVVLETLKKRFAELTKRFQSTLQERTKLYMGKAEAGRAERAARRAPRRATRRCAKSCSPRTSS